MYSLGIKSGLIRYPQNYPKLLKRNPHTFLKNIPFHAHIFKFHSYPLINHPNSSNSF